MDESRALQSCLSSSGSTGLCIVRVYPPLSVTDGMPLDRSLWEFLRFILETAVEWLVAHEPPQEEVSSSDTESETLAGPSQPAAPSTASEASRPPGYAVDTPQLSEGDIESLRLSGYNSSEDESVRAGTRFIQCFCCTNAAVHACRRNNATVIQDWHCQAHTPRTCPHFVTGLDQRLQCRGFQPRLRPTVGRRVRGQPNV